MRPLRIALFLWACSLVLAVAAVSTPVVARPVVRYAAWSVNAGVPMPVPLAWMALAPAAATSQPTDEHLVLPELSATYRIALTREAQAVWGLDAPVARIAAQIHQESRWKPDARSPYAQGLAQFTPDTATWLAKEVDECNPADPWDPGWSVRCAVRYDAWLLARSPGSTDCDRWAFTLASYNGGLGWTLRDRRAARAAGVSDQTWFGGVEFTPDTRRAPANIEQNRDYVRVILRRWEPAYIAAGWPGQVACT